MCAFWQKTYGDEPRPGHPVRESESDDDARLDVDDFYIAEEYRGQGIGTSVLQKAKAIAIKRGCTRCVLSTFEFQARVFYEKQGYSVSGKLQDYPPGSAYYWMRKELLPERS
jgi:GNAT superfamily N-acetyltransferase